MKFKKRESDRNEAEHKLTQKVVFVLSGAYSLGLGVVVADSGDAEGCLA